MAYTFNNDCKTEILSTTITKIALILAGRIKCWESNLLPQLQKFHIENPDIIIDIYASINDTMNDDYSKFIEIAKPVYVYIAPFQCDQKYIEYKNINPEYQSFRHMLGNFVSHMFNIKKACEQIPEYIYERVILYRTDIVSNNHSFLDIRHPVEDNKIYTRLREIYSVLMVNNEIIYGNLEVMRKYCSLYDVFDKYLEEGIKLHPETMADIHIKKLQFERTDFVFDYILDNSRRKI